MKRVISLFLFVFVIATAVLLTACKPVTDSGSELPAAPSGLQTSVKSSSSIDIAWNNVSGASYYRVYYQETSDTHSLMEAVSGTSCSITKLAANSEYIFGVSACNSHGESDISELVRARSLPNTKSGMYKDITSKTSVTVDNLDGNEVYILKYNPTESTIKYWNTSYIESCSPSCSDAAADENSAARNAETGKYRSLNGNGISGVQKGGIVRYDNAEALAFNNNPPFAGECTVSSSMKSVVPETMKSEAAVGDSRSFWVQNADSTWKQITAVLRASGSYCYVWVAEANYSAASESKTDEKITSAQAQAVADNFDTVFPAETAVFGSKYSSSDQKTNLVAPSGKISILVYDIDYDYSSSQTGGTFGFFWAKDLYTDAYIQTKGDYRSNETELFYIDALFTDLVPNMMYSTLAHEFQHMLHFVHKSVEKNLSSSTWYNEMLSMLCEDMLQNTLGITDNESPKGRLPYFNYYYNGGMTTWRTGKDVLISYANAYAFGAYLVRNYGGASFLHDMAENDSVDMDSIDAAIAAEGGSDTCETAFLKYGESLVYTDSDSGKKYPSFNKTAFSTVGGYDFTFAPIDLCSYYETDSSNAYIGPVIYAASYSGSQHLYPWGFSVHKAGKYTGSVTFKMGKPLVSSEKVYILVK